MPPNIKGKGNAWGGKGFASGQKDLFYLKSRDISDLCSRRMRIFQFVLSVLPKGVWEACSFHLV